MSGLRKLLSKDLGARTRCFRSGKEAPPVLAQAFNFMIQSTGGNFPMGRVHRFYGEERRDEKIAGQVRMNVENQRLVYLLRYIYEETKDGGTVTIWHVRDVLSDDSYRLKQRSIGCSFNEMEVIAWAART